MPVTTTFVHSASAEAVHRTTELLELVVSSAVWQALRLWSQLDKRTRKVVLVECHRRITYVLFPFFQKDEVDQLFEALKFGHGVVAGMYQVDAVERALEELGYTDFQEEQVHEPLRGEVTKIRRGWKTIGINHVLLSSVWTGQMNCIGPTAAYSFYPRLVTENMSLRTDLHPSWIEPERPQGLVPHWQRGQHSQETVRLITSSADFPCDCAAWCPALNRKTRGDEAVSAAPWRKGSPTFLDPNDHDFALQPAEDHGEGPDLHLRVDEAAGKVFLEVPDDCYEMIGAAIQRDPRLELIKSPVQGFEVYYRWRYSSQGNDLVARVAVVDLLQTSSNHVRDAAQKDSLTLPAHESQGTSYSSLMSLRSRTTRTSSHMSVVAVSDAKDPDGLIPHHFPQAVPEPVQLTLDSFYSRECLLHPLCSRIHLSCPVLNGMPSGLLNVAVDSRECHELVMIWILVTVQPGGVIFVDRIQGPNDLAFGRFRRHFKAIPSGFPTQPIFIANDVFAIPQAQIALNPGAQWLK
ncbi:hypothetical protein BKA70DRAFT_1238721 [Coprinopsis sp. MPI-PUGE-AT-0042]|nr:hypothetical protein BKA70DRAFT_1238721 [Coprinopsis sp. MPI-PUGE-AT-0042]